MKVEDDTAPLNGSGASVPDYWDRYYQSEEVPLIPSQFLVFVLGEFPSPPAVVDIGCGSGRDAFFFARHGIPTIGIDGSTSAIDLSARNKELQKLDKLRLCRVRVGDPDFPERIRHELRCLQISGAVLYYARFFLHAISEEEEATLLQHVSTLLREHGGMLAVEFRTRRDQGQAKVTPDHYRRFVDPLSFMLAATGCGLKIEYFVEGFGFAKYKRDDAHIARCMFSVSPR